MYQSWINFFSYETLPVSQKKILTCFYKHIVSICERTLPVQGMANMTLAALAILTIPSALLKTVICIPKASQQGLFPHLATFSFLG